MAFAWIVIGIIIVVGSVSGVVILPPAPPRTQPLPPAWRAPSSVLSICTLRVEFADTAMRGGVVITEGYAGKPSVYAMLLDADPVYSSRRSTTLMQRAFLPTFRQVCCGGTRHNLR